MVNSICPNPPQHRGDTIYTRDKRLSSRVGGRRTLMTISREAAQPLLSTSWHAWVLVQSCVTARSRPESLRGKLMREMENECAQSSPFLGDKGLPSEDSYQLYQNSEKKFLEKVASAKNKHCYPVSSPQRHAGMHQFFLSSPTTPPPHSLFLSIVYVFGFYLFAHKKRPIGICRKHILALSWQRDGNEAGVTSWRPTHTGKWETNVPHCGVCPSPQPRLQPLHRATGPKED